MQPTLWHGIAHTHPGLSKRGCAWLGACAAHAGSASLWLVLLPGQHAHLLRHTRVQSVFSVAGRLQAICAMRLFWGVYGLQAAMSRVASQAGKPERRSVCSSLVV